MIKVGVIVGHHDARPYCYWEKLLKDLEPWDVESCLEKNLPPEWPKYNVCIINWDVANGSLSYPAKVLSYFDLTVRDPLIKWIQGNPGGILFCEIQSRFGIPCQDSYDQIFGKGMLTVLSEDESESDGEQSSKFVGLVTGLLHKFSIRKKREATKKFITESGRNYENRLKLSGEATRGSIVQVNPRHRAHPLVYGIYPFLQREFGYANEPILPSDLWEERDFKFSLYYRCPETLYSGWFIDWKFGWIPVLLDSSGKWPVLLTRMDKEGAWIASTMRITSPSLMPLVRNLVNFPIYKNEWKKYHGQVIRQRHRADRIALTLIAVAVILVILALGILWRSGVLAQVGQLGPIILTVLGILGVGLISVASFFITRMRNYMKRRIK